MFLSPDAYSQSPSVLLYGVCRCVSSGLCRARASDLSQHSLPTPPPSLPHREQMDEWAAMSLPPNQEVCLAGSESQIEDMCYLYDFKYTNLVKKFL